MTATPVVFVTGGTGFVGSTLLRTLARRGHCVHALLRAGSDHAHLADCPVTWHIGDLSEAAPLVRGLAAARAEAESQSRALWVVHAAAVISYHRADEALSHAVNIDGTRRLLAACASVGIDRMCFVSSVDAVGQAPDGEALLNEDSAYLGDELHCAYVTTKRRAEELVLATSGAFEVVVVNPGAIFGPAPTPSNTTRFLARAISLRYTPPAPPGCLSVVGVQDVVDGILLALKRGRDRRRYLLTESNWTPLELMALVRGAAGRRSTRHSFARGSWRMLVRTVRFFDAVRPLEFTAPQALMLLGEHLRFDASRARAALGWRPQPFTEVFAATLDWMQSEGLVPVAPEPLVFST